MKQSLTEGLGQLTSVIIDESNRSIQYMKDLQVAVCAGNNRIQVAASKLERSASTIEKGVSSIPLNYRRPGPVSRRVGNNSSRKGAVRGLRKDVQQLTTMMRECSTVNPIPRSAMRYSGDSHERILLSMLLLKPQLTSAVASLAMDQDLEFPSCHLNWLSSQFEILLSSVLRNVDGLATHEDPFDTLRHGYMVSNHPAYPRSRQSTHQRQHVQQYEWRKAFISKRPVRRVWNFRSPSGDLSICNNMHRSLKGKEDFGSEALDVELTFRPRQNVHQTALVARFQEQYTVSVVPQIERHLHSYIQISYTDFRELYELLEFGTIREIDEAFRACKHSPYVIDFNGRSIHYV